MIEHIGLVVTDSRAMAAWYAQHLGFDILRSFDTGSGHVAFIQSPATGLIFELITHCDRPPIEPALSDPLQFHIALKTDDIICQRDRLVAAGATFVTDCPTDDPDARVMVLRDPWGLFIQLAQRRDDFYA